MYKVFLDDQLIHSSDGVGITERVQSPQLKLELNKSGALQFDIYSVHPIYDSVKPLASIVDVYQDDEHIYRGRVITVDLDIDGKKSVQCEGDLSFFCDTVQLKGEWTETAAQHFRRIINQHNSVADDNKKFTVGEITIKSANKTETWKNTSYGDSQHALMNELVDIFGGYLRTRTVNGVHYIDYLEDYGVTSEEPIQFGKNMLTMSCTESGEDIFTILLPTGEKDVTIASANNNSIYLVNNDAIAKYGRIIRIQDFDGEETATSLKTAAQKYMKDNYHDIPLSFEINAMDFHFIDGSVAPYGLGWMYPIKSEVHNIDTTLICSSVQYDLDNPDNTSLSFGDIQVLNPPRSQKKAKSSRSKRGGGRGTGGGSDITGNTNETQNQVQETVNKLTNVEDNVDEVKAEFGRFKQLIAEKLDFGEGTGDELVITTRFSCQSVGYVKDLRSNTLQIATVPTVQGQQVLVSRTNYSWTSQKVVTAVTLSGDDLNVTTKYLYFYGMVP